MLALLVTAVPQVSADDSDGESGVLLSHMTITFESGTSCCWVGTINGPLRGTVSFQELPATVVDGIEYFHEAFTIATSKGTLEGEDWGVYNLVTAEFWAHGTVLEATGRWTDLVGYTAFEWGLTTEPFVFPMIATNIPVVLVPPQPTPAKDREAHVAYDDMAYSDCWRGDLSGDLVGTGAICLDPATYTLGNEEYFFESSVFQARQGVLRGEDRGVFDLTTGNFWAVGRITDASGKWHFMEGYAYVSFGTVSFQDFTAYAPFVFVDA